MTQMVSVRILTGLLFCRTWLAEDTVCDMPRDLAGKYAESKPPLVTIEGEPTGDEIKIPKIKTGKRIHRNDPEDTVETDGFLSPESPSLSNASTPDFDFPGGPHWEAIGINSVESVRKFITEHGENFSTKVKGIGKSTAAEIIETLQELDDANDDAE